MVIVLVYLSVKYADFIFLSGRSYVKCGKYFLGLFVKLWCDII